MKIRSNITISFLLAVCSTLAFADTQTARFEAYDARRLETLRSITENVKEKNDQAGKNLRFATALLYLEQDVEEANRIIMDADLKQLYWSSRNFLIPLFLDFNADTGSRKKLLTRAATDKILDYLWSGFSEPERKFFRNPYHVMPDVPWNYQGNQNHGFTFQTLYYFSALILKDYPKYAEQFDATQHIALGRGVDSLDDHPELVQMTLAQYAERSAELWRNRFLWMASQGFWSEEMIYGNMSLGETYLLHYYSPDPVVRQRAKMTLDIHWIMIGLHMVDGIRGGAQNRYKQHHDGYHPERAIAWHYFGGRSGSPGPYSFPLMGDYIPTELAYEIWENPEQRGSFSYLERLTQFSPITGQPPHAYKYSYVTPEYVMGSITAHVIDEKGGYMRGREDRVMGEYHERTMLGVTLGKSRTILRLMPIVPFESYHTMQHGPILMARYYGRELKGDKTVLDPYLQLLSRKDGGVPIETPIEEDGWVFIRADDAYLALRPAKGECSVKDDRFEWPDPQMPILIHAGGATDDGTFDEFKRKVLSNTVSYWSNVLKYSDPKWGTMEFCSDPDKPNDQWRRVNGEPVPLPDMLFMSPYLRSYYNSGVIHAIFGEHKRVFDFHNNVSTYTNTRQNVEVPH